MHYIKQAAAILVPVLLTDTLTKQDAELDEKDDWGLSQSGSVCLGLVAPPSGAGAAVDHWAPSAPLSPFLPPGHRPPHTVERGTRGGGAGGGWGWRARGQRRAEWGARLGCAGWRAPPPGRRRR